MLGRLGTSLERLQPAFRTKLRHSVWDAIMYSIFDRFDEDLCFIRTRGKALWYYKNRSFELSYDFNIKLF